MKKLLKLTSLLLIVALILNVAACASSYGKIQKALENAGYSVVEEMESLTDSTKEKLEKEADEKLALEIHVFKKIDGFSSALVLVLEFSATEDLVEYVKGSETAQGFIKDVASDEDVNAFYNTLVEEGYANGNCLVFAISLTETDNVKELVKNA